MIARLLGRLDTVLHRTLDWYINRQLPFWGRLQLWQHYVCDAYERRVWTVPDAEQ